MASVARRVFSSKAKVSQSVSLPVLLKEKASQFKHAKDLVRYGPLENGMWTVDEFSKLVSEHAVGLLDARFRPRDALLLHLGEFELENVVSFFAGASAALRMSVMNEQKSVGDALNESQARGAIVTRQHVDSYFKTISELERTPYGRDYAFVDFPNVKMLLQTGRDPIPGFYSYESTFVSGAMPDPLPAILQQLTGESEVAFSLSDKKKSFSHAALIKAGTQFGSDLALNFQDRVLVALPQNRLSGIACGIVPCLAHASLFVLDGPDFDAKRQVALLAQEGCNVLVGSPSLLQKIFAVPEFSKSADKISKIAIVVDQNSALERQQQPLVVSQAKTLLPNLAVTVVSNVDDRNAIGPISSTVTGKQ